MSEEKYDPIKEINEATLCLHCIHKSVCIIKEETRKFENKWNEHVYGLSRLLSQMAETCKYYERKFQCKLLGIYEPILDTEKCFSCDFKCKIKGLI